LSISKEEKKKSNPEEIYQKTPFIGGDSSSVSEVTVFEQVKLKSTFYYGAASILIAPAQVLPRPYMAKYKSSIFKRHISPGWNQPEPP
jgi:hypothetical protein